MHAPARAFARLTKRGQKYFPIAVIPEDRLSSITAIEEVIDSTIEFNACFPGHEHADRIQPLAQSSSQICRDSQTDPFSFPIRDSGASVPVFGTASQKLSYLFEFHICDIQRCLSRIVLDSWIRPVAEQ